MLRSTFIMAIYVTERNHSDSFLFCKGAPMARGSEAVPITKCYSNKWPSLVSTDSLSFLYILVMKRKKERNGKLPFK